jgi:hypothetical protein
VAVPFDTVNGYWFVVVNLLAGSLSGAWIGAAWATRMRSATLYRVLAVLLVLIAIALAWNHFGDLNPVLLDPVLRTLLGIAAGVGIGIVAALMGVAGGELLIPTIVLLFAVDIKIAGSLALAISLPTMLVAFARYRRDRSFAILRANKGFVLHGDRIDHRHHPRRSPPRCRPRRRADPPAGRAAPCVCGQGLAPRLTIKLFVPALLAVPARGRLASGEPNRAAGHVRRMIPRDVSDRRPPFSVLKADVSRRLLPSIHSRVGARAGGPDLA